MPNVTLADIRAAADAKYGPFVIDLGDNTTGVTLTNALRLDKDARASLQAQLAELRSPGADAEAVLRSIFETIATPDDVARIYAATGGETILLVELLNAYGKGTQVGEASSSAS